MPSDSDSSKFLRPAFQQTKEVSVALVGTSESVRAAVSDVSGRNTTNGFKQRVSNVKAFAGDMRRERTFENTSSSKMSEAAVDDVHVLVKGRVASKSTGAADNPAEERASIVETSTVTDRGVKGISSEGIRSASAAVEDASIEKPSSEKDTSIVASHRAPVVEARKNTSVSKASAEEDGFASNTHPLSRTASVDVQASSGNVLFLLSDLYERFGDCCVRVRYRLNGKTQVASGFFVSNKGHVLTPAIGGEEFYVETRSHRQFSAKKCGEDAVSSLCLLQVDEGQLREGGDKAGLKTQSYFSLLRDVEWPKIGQPVVGLSCKLGGAVSPQIGYVTAFQERYFATEFPFVFVRSSLRIDAGDCGGAVLDVRGNLLGMLFHALPDTQEAFYMPSQALERLFRDLLLFGSVRYAYAGLSVASMYDPKTHAVRLQVQTVQPNSPAAQSGFKVNDVLLRVNDNEINSMELFKNFIFLSKPGDVLQYTVMRGKKTLNLTLTLVEKQ